MHIFYLGIQHLSKRIFLLCRIFQQTAVFNQTIFVYDIGIKSIGKGIITMTNKELVLKFYEEVFNNWDISNLDSYMKDDYIQHNPTAPDGKEGFIEFTKFFFGLKPHMDIIKIGEDGDMVYVFFKCTLENGAINKVCDIYRIEDGKLAEHWDVVEHNVQDIVPVHDNGLF